VWDINGFHYEVRRAKSVDNSQRNSQPKSQENHIIIHKKRNLKNQVPLLIEQYIFIELMHPLA
jgi:hypothetical protein